MQLIIVAILLALCILLLILNEVLGNKKESEFRILIVIIATITILPALIEILMGRITSNAGDDGDWLGFWGGYLGATITVAGVYWQVRKQSKDSDEQLNKQLEVSQKQLKEQLKAEKEASFREARPLFIASFIEERPVQRFNVPIYHSFKNATHLGTGDKLQFLSIKNVSNNSMMGVEIQLLEKNDKLDSIIKIDNIMGNSKCLIVNQKTLDKISSWSTLKSEPNTDTFKSVKELQKLDRIVIYFTTSIREKISLTFLVKNNGNLEYDRTSSRIENQGDVISEYNLDNFEESFKD